METETEQRKPGVQERLDRLPTPKAVASATAYKVYSEAVTATGKVTMAPVKQWRRHAGVALMIGF